MAKNWLKQRSKILAKYAKNLPLKQDRIQIKFDYPEAGWLPVHFHRNGKNRGTIEFSYVYDCFEPLKEWLETIANIATNKASIRILDCEYTMLVLSYEPIWFYDYEEYDNRKLCPYDCGIFSVYDENKDKFLLDAYCKTETFVRDVYKCIIDFAKAMKEKPEFVKDWTVENWSHELSKINNDDDPDLTSLFLEKVKSPLIEKYIRDRDLLNKNANHFKRKSNKLIKK